MTITLREEKGSPLTHQEMDNNTKYLSGCLNMNAFLHIQDQKPQGTHGGTFTAGDWRTRDLNTVLTNTISGASLAANQITLPAGRYYVEASAPGYYCGRHQAKLRRITATAADILLGTCLIATQHSTANYAAAASARSTVSGTFQIGSDVVFELQHQCQTTQNTDFGVSANFTTEIYSDIRIWRVGESDE